MKQTYSSTKTLLNSNNLTRSNKFDYNACSSHSFGRSFTLALKHQHFIYTNVCIKNEKKVYWNPIEWFLIQSKTIEFERMNEIWIKL